MVGGRAMALPQAMQQGEATRRTASLPTSGVLPQPCPGPGLLQGDLGRPHQFLATEQSADPHVAWAACRYAEQRSFQPAGCLYEVIVAGYDTDHFVHLAPYENVTVRG